MEILTQFHPNLSVHFERDMIKLMAEGSAGGRERATTSIHGEARDCCTKGACQSSHLSVSVDIVLTLFSHHYLISWRDGMGILVEFRPPILGGSRERDWVGGHGLRWQRATGADLSASWPSMAGTAQA